MLCFVVVCCCFVVVLSTPALLFTDVESKGIAGDAVMSSSFRGKTIGLINPVFFTHKE